MAMMLTRLVTLLALSTTLLADDPPETWKEHWFEHNQTVTRVFFDADLALYYDNDMDFNITWPRQYLGDVWRYVKKLYGEFGDDKHLYAIFHKGKYSGGHPSTYFDASHDNRNVIDVGSLASDAWSDPNDLSIVTHEVSHIVEFASKGIHNSPAFNIWKDSKWAEIFIYDVYIALGKDTQRDTWYNSLQDNTDDFPTAGSHWFRDWFYPIYNDHGGNETLNNYFDLLAQYFPKKANNDKEYDRDMNWGEFIHFWSGAAATNLTDLATSAFGWSNDWTTLYNTAVSDFPDITY